jgi:CheY-like chemotaxis protein
VDGLLVVDDEDMIRSTAEAILEDLGYEVLLAEDGQKALSIFQEQSGTVDLVLLDMLMPVMSGKDCFVAMKQFDPEVRVVLSSGFTREEDLLEMQKLGLKGFLRKPYRVADLCQAIHEALK